MAGQFQSQWIVGRSLDPAENFGLLRNGLEGKIRVRILGETFGAPAGFSSILWMHVARTSARYSAVSSATKSLLYVANRLYSCDLLRDRPLPRFCSPARVSVPEFAELGKAFRILRCFHAAVSMGDAVDPRRCGWAAGMGAVDPPDSISSSRTDAPLRCIRRVRLSLAFCLRMCRIPRDTEELLADAADSGRSSDDPWKDDHASTLAGRVRDAAVAARARAAVDTDGIPIFKKNKNEHISRRRDASRPALYVPYVT